MTRLQHRETAGSEIWHKLNQGAQQRESPLLPRQTNRQTDRPVFTLAALQPWESLCAAR